MGLPIRSAADSVVESSDQIDFTGGLNLNREEFKLAQNETPDCMDVDFGRYGGLRQRKHYEVLPTYSYRPGYRGLPIWHDDTSAKAIACYGSSPSLNMVAVDLDANTHSASLLFSGTIEYQARGDMYDGDLWVTFLDPAGTTGFERKYNGTSLTTLTDAVGSWDPDYNTPSGTKHVAHAVQCIQHDRLWVGYTRESSVDYPSRVRFSFAGDPGSWLEGDSIDIERGKNGDHVTAIRALGDHVLVFKRSSVHMIAGYDESSFQVITLQDGVGAVSQEATVVGLGRCWFFDPDQGLMSITPNGEISNHYNQIVPLLRDGIQDTSITAHVGVVRERVFVNIGEDGVDGHNVNTYVYDPLLDAWTRYSDSFVSFTTINRDGQSETWAYKNTSAGLAGLTELNRNSTQATSAWNCYWLSPWMTAGEPADRKRWRRAKIVAGLNDGSADCDIKIDVYKDYDISTVASTVTRTLTEEVEIIKGPGTARSEAIAYKLTLVPDGSAVYSWSLHSLGARWKRSGSRR